VGNGPSFFDVPAVLSLFYEIISKIFDKKNYVIIGITLRYDEGAFNGMALTL
jgi:hypothetical protein